MKSYLNSAMLNHLKWKWSNFIFCSKIIENWKTPENPLVFTENWKISRFKNFIFTWEFRFYSSSTISAEIKYTNSSTRWRLFKFKLSIICKLEKWLFQKIYLRRDIFRKKRYFQKKWIFRNFRGKIAFLITISIFRKNDFQLLDRIVIFIENVFFFKNLIFRKTFLKTFFRTWLTLGYLTLDRVKDYLQD